MSLQPGDALTTHNFGLQIDGVMVEYLAGGQRPDHRAGRHRVPAGLGARASRSSGSMPGVKKAGEITVTRGMTQRAAFTEWINES